MKETIERESKLTPGEGFVLPELGGEPQPTRVFVSTYHDTADLVLARHGVTLRHAARGGLEPHPRLPPLPQCLTPLALRGSRFLL